MCIKQRHDVRLTVPRFLLILVAAVAVIDCVWAVQGRFSIDILGYVKLTLLSAGLFFGAGFYTRLRPDPRLAAMLFGAGFLCAFSAGASLLNYFLLTVAGAPVDPLLANGDRMLGFHWRDMMIGLASYPLLNEIFFRAYNLVLPQMAILIVVLAWSGRTDQLYRYCLTVGLGALIAMAIWTVMPSAGANAVYTLPAQVESHLTLSSTTQYGRELLALLQEGPGYITPADMRGLIGFPSYHGVLALLLIWFARPLRWLFWPYLAINAIVLISTPVQGGHHLVDVLASLPVTALSLALAGEFGSFSLRPLTLVNNFSRLRTEWFPKGILRIARKRDASKVPDSIKSKLSHVP